MEESNTVNHPIYPRNDETAMAHTYAFKTPQNFGPYNCDYPAIKEDEILGDILYTGLCMSDVHNGRGLWGKNQNIVCPGHEIIARVVQVGPKTTLHKVGDIIGVGPMRKSCQECSYCKEDFDVICQDIEYGEKKTYGKYFGGYSTRIHVHERWAIPIPSGLDLSKAGPLLCAGVTVHNPLKRNVRPGDTVGVIGVGGLGHMAIQYAHHLGAKVVAFTSSSNKEDFIKKLGADQVVQYSAEDLSTVVPNSLNVLIDTRPCNVSKENYNTFLKALRPNGTYVLVGLPEANETLQFSYFPLVTKNIRVVGSLVGSVKDQKEMLQFSAEKGIECMCEVYSFEDFPKALNRLENERPLFRCVVDVQSYAKKNGLEYKE